MVLTRHITNIPIENTPLAWYDKNRIGGIVYGRKRCGGKNIRILQ